MKKAKATTRRITETRVREIYAALRLTTINGDDLLLIPRDDLCAADKWMKHYALTRFAKHADVKAMRPCLRQFILSTVRIYYGSIDVDDLLVKLKCYPAWLGSQDR